MRSWYCCGPVPIVAFLWWSGTPPRLQGDRLGQCSARIGGKSRMPSEILLEEFLLPIGLSQNGLARALRVPPRRVNEIVLGKRALSVDTALRLSRYFGLSDTFWTELQTRHDLEIERVELNSVLASIMPRGA